MSKWREGKVNKRKDVNNSSGGYGQNTNSELRFPLFSHLVRITCALIRHPLMYHGPMVARTWLDEGIEG